MEGESARFQISFSMYFATVSIYNKKNISQYEENYIHDDEMKVLYRKTYNLIGNNYEELSKYHFFDISDIFAETKEPLYIEYCHTNEDGNKAIAERMANDVLEIIRSNK